MLSHLNLEIPYFILSTTVSLNGEMMKRFATPFGNIEVTYRRLLKASSGPEEMEIEVSGDTDHWVSTEFPLSPFKNALLTFVWRLSQQALKFENFCSINDLNVRVLGDRTIRISCGKFCRKHPG